jgi:hypothetical protein
MNPDAIPLPSKENGVRAYMLFCLAALVMISLAQLQNGRDLPGVLAVAALGAVAVVARWSSGSPLLVAGLIAVETFHRYSRPRFGYRDDVLVMDAVLAAATIAFAAGLYRLVSVSHTVLPIDRRLTLARPRPSDRRRARDDGRRPRPGWQVTPLEPALLSAAAAATAAAVVGVWMTAELIKPPSLWVQAYLDAERPASAARAAWPWALTIWVLGGAAVVAAFLAAYFGWRAATPDEALLYLQDLAWRETRRDLTRVNRWTTWRRLIAARRKEKS